jgi:hypothetical protein
VHSVDFNIPTSTSSDVSVLTLSGFDVSFKCLKLALCESRTNVPLRDDLDVMRSSRTSVRERDVFLVLYIRNSTHQYQVRTLFSTPKIKRLAREEEQSKAKQRKAGIDLEHHVKAIVLRDLTERATGLFVDRVRSVVECDVASFWSKAGHDDYSF